VDRWILDGHVKFLWVIGCNKFENSMASEALHDYFRQHVTLSPHQIDSTDPKRAIEVLKARVDNGDMAVFNSEIYLRTIGNQYADIVFPAATWGEADFTRAQGERVLRIYAKFYDPPGEAKPDWWIIAQVAKKMGFAGYDWKESQDVFKEAARFTRGGILEYAPLLPYAKLKGKQPYELLRERGPMGYQLPLRLHDGELIETKSTNKETEAANIETPQGISTMQKRLSGFTRPSGKALLHIADWKLFKDYWEYVSPKKEKGEIWVTNGRVNEIWQSLFDDMRKPYIMQRYPMNFVEMSPEDAKARGIANGDIVSLENDEVLNQVSGFYFLRDSDALFTSLMKNGHIKVTKGAVTAMVFVTDAVPPGVSFMYFLWPGAGTVLTPNVPDPITGAPRYKTGKAVIKKIGTLPEHIKSRITWANKNAV
jgi:arsenite oxidase large subunit